MTEIITFNFGLDLQVKLLALLVKDKDFLSKNHNFIKPYYFESDVLVDLSRIVINYYRQYKTTVGFSVMLSELDRFLTEHKRHNIDEYYTVVKNLFTQQILEKQYIVDKTIEFITYQEYKRAISGSIDLLGKGDLPAVKQIFDKTSKLSFNVQKGMMYFNPEEIKTRFEDDSSQKSPTGIVGLDDALEGGLGVGELGIVMAPPNVGKSILLTILGGGSLKLRKKVVHFSFEMRQKKVGLRYDRHLLGKGVVAIKDNLEDAESFLVQFSRNLKCNLYIKDWPTRTATVGDLRTELEYLKSEGFDPDLVLVDYASIMKPTRKRDGRHQEIEEINEELRGMAGEFAISVWTAAQTTREAVNKAIIDISDLGESFAQSKVADIVVAVCQTDKEYKDSTIRLFMAKNRDGQKHRMLRYHIDYTTLRLVYVT